MVAELDSIADPSERRRFALGAFAAIARLALSGFGQGAIDQQGVGLGDSEGRGRSVPQITTGQLLRRHANPFGVSFASLTLLLLLYHATWQVPQLSERGMPPGVIAEAMLLAVPFTLALTIPMAVFLAVSWVFTRLGDEGALVLARRERHGVRRLVAPVLGAAAVIATLTFVSNVEVLPRANARLVAILEGAPQAPTDRTMTIGELREAAQRARTATNADDSRAVTYEVEIHKKFALAAACVVLALAGAAIAIRFPYGGVGIVLSTSGLVFTGYYLSLVAGESLADREVISPLVGMWIANAFLLAVALLLVWRPSRPHRAETLALGG